MKKVGIVSLLMLCFAINLAAGLPYRGRVRKKALVKKNSWAKKRGFGNESFFENRTPYSIAFYKIDDTKGYAHNNSFFIVIDSDGNGFRYDMADILTRIFPDVPERCSKTITKLKFELEPGSWDLIFTLFLKAKKSGTHNQSVMSAVSCRINNTGFFALKSLSVGAFSIESLNGVSFVNSTPFSIKFNGIEFCTGFIVDACRNKLQWNLLHSDLGEKSLDGSKELRTLRVETTEDPKKLRFTLFFVDSSKQILNRYFSDFCSYVR